MPAGDAPGGFLLQMFFVLPGRGVMFDRGGLGLRYQQRTKGQA
jgi:hypothetical protein